MNSEQQREYYQQNPLKAQERRDKERLRIAAKRAALKSVATKPVVTEPVATITKPVATITKPVTTRCDEVVSEAEPSRMIYRHVEPWREVVSECLSASEH